MLSNIRFGRRRIVIGVTGAAAVVILAAALVDATSSTNMRGGGATEIAGRRRANEAPIERSTAQVTREVEQPSISKENAQRQIAAMPMVFVQNDGQSDPRARFTARGHGIDAAFTDRGLALGLESKDEKGEPSVTHVALDFMAGDMTCEPKGDGKLAGVHNYLLGGDPAEWHTSVPLFERVRYDRIAPGVAMVVSDRDGRLEYDLHVEPGADLGAVRVECEGVDRIELADNGTLSLATAAGTLAQSPPKAWYERKSGESEPADCRFKVFGSMSYGFEVLNPDPRSKLIVDPGLTWSTFLGSDTSDAAFSVDFDNGKLTVVGITTKDASTTQAFPTTTGVLQTTHGGSDDVFVTRFDPAQSGSSQLVWSTFIGGSDSEWASSVQVVSNGNVALCGRTWSSNYPVTSSTALQSTRPYSSNYSGFVTYLDSTGSSLLYSSYYGGNGVTWANACEIDATPTITIVGYTEATNLPLSSTPYDSGNSGGPGDAFVAQFDPAQSGTSSLVYASYLGGSNATEKDEAFAVALSGPCTFVGGETQSSSFETTTGSSGSKAAFDGSHNGGRDGFLLYLDASLGASAQLKYSTFLGGSVDDTVFGVFVNGGVIYACGKTASSDFPVTTSTSGGDGPGFQGSYNGSVDAFIAKLDPSATTQLKYSSYLGGSSTDVAFSIVRVTSMCVVVVGYTASSGFPSGPANVAYDTTHNGGRDVFLVRLNWANGRTGSAQLDYGTFVGSSSDEEAYRVVLNANDAYFGGYTLSSGYPTAGSPYDSSWNGGSQFGDAYASLIGLPLLQTP